MIVGIACDLARVMAFNSLYRLEESGLLTSPIASVAVSDRSAKGLRRHARGEIVGCGTEIDGSVHMFRDRLGVHETETPVAALAETTRGTASPSRQLMLHTKAPSDPNQRQRLR